MCVCVHAHTYEGMHFIVKSCDDLNENGPHGSSAYGIVWKRVGGLAFLIEVSLRKDFEVSKTLLVSPPLSPCDLKIRR